MDSGWQVGREEGELEGMSNRNTLSSWVYSRNARLVQELEIYQCDKCKAERSLGTEKRKYFIEF